MDSERYVKSEDEREKHRLFVWEESIQTQLVQKLNRECGASLLTHMDSQELEVYVFKSFWKS